MAFARPTLSELVERIQQDFLSRLALTAPILRRAFVYILARVQAGAAHMLHGHLEYLSRQIFPDQSEDEFLLRQAALFGLSRKAAQFASGDVIFTGTDGALIPVATMLLRADGAEYQTGADATIALGTASAPVVASLAGEDQNCGAGTALSFESPIAGVTATATVAAGGIVNGSDEEDLEDLRTRLLERLRSPPHGGAAADYVAWAKEVPGVTRCWVFPLELGAGTVVVRFARDDDASLIPDAGEVAVVQDYLDERRPVTAVVTVQAPVAVVLDLTISITPDTSTIRAAVEAELRDFLFRAARPGGIIFRSQLEIAVGVAEGVQDFTVVAPAGDVTHTTGQIAIMGTITWV